MARTKGSGWGGGIILYQKCPFCNKKKVMYDPLLDYNPHPFKCTLCKERFASNELKRITYQEQLLRSKN